MSTSLIVFNFVSLFFFTSHESITEDLAKNCAISQALQIIYPKIEDDIELRAKIASKIPDPSEKLLNSAFEKEADLNHKLELAQGWTLHNSLYLILKLGCKMSKVIKDVDDPTGQKYTMTITYDKRGLTLSATGQNKVARLAQKFAALELVIQLLDYNIVEPAETSSDYASIQKRTKTDFRSKPFAFDFNSEQGTTICKKSAFDQFSSNKIDPIKDRMRNVIWPECPAAWLKNFLQYFREMISGFDFKEENRSDEGRYLCTGVLCYTSGNRPTFSAEAHSQVVAKKYASCLMVRHLVDTGLVVQADVKLPQLQEWVDLSIEYSNLIAQAGGYHINSVAGRLNDFFTYFSITPQYNVEPVNQFRQMCHASFWLEGIEYSASRQGLNDKESKKMAQLELIGQLIKNKKIEEFGDPKIGSVKTRSTQFSTTRNTGCGISSIGSSSRRSRYDEYEDFFEQIKQKKLEDRMRNLELQETYDAKERQARAEIEAIHLAERENIPPESELAVVNPDDSASNIHGGNSNQRLPNLVARNEPKRRVHLTAQNNFPYADIRSPKSKTTPHKVALDTDFDNSSTISFSANSNLVSDNFYEKIAKKLPENKSIADYQSKYLNSYLEVDEWILMFEIQNSSYFKSPTQVKQAKMIEHLPDIAEGNMENLETLPAASEKRNVLENYGLRVSFWRFLKKSDTQIK